MNVTLDTPAGTQVSIDRDVDQPMTGTTIGVPVLTPSGYVVSVKLDAEFAHHSPTGSFDYAVDRLEVREFAIATSATCPSLVFIQEISGDTDPSLTYTAFQALYLARVMVRAGMSVAYMNRARGQVYLTMDSRHL